MANLFDPFTVRSITFNNRMWVSPMCQYSATDGLPNDWHIVHLGSRAVGGAGLIVAEATAVTAEGRISPEDTGLWNDEQVVAWSRITSFISEQGSVPGVQLAHAGRKASTYAPWRGHGSVPATEGGWPTIGPSAVAFDGYAVPQEMTLDDIAYVKEAFASGAQCALDAGFKVIELHAAHGYLLHQFLSPLANHRTDAYGGDLQGRMRLTIEVAEAVRSVWPQGLPLFVRVSSTDWVEGGWDLDSSIELAKQLKDVGVDLIDASSGGAVGTAKIPVGPGYQVPFAKAIRAESGIATAAVGMITDAKQADDIISSGEADAVFVAREFLRNPYFVAEAAAEIGANAPWPVQYDRAQLR